MRKLRKAEIVNHVREAYFVLEKLESFFAEFLNKRHPTYDEILQIALAHLDLILSRKTERVRVLERKRKAAITKAAHEEAIIAGRSRRPSALSKLPVDTDGEG